MKYLLPPQAGLTRHSAPAQEIFLAPIEPFPEPMGDAYNRLCRGLPLHGSPHRAVARVEKHGHSLRWAILASP